MNFKDDVIGKCLVLCDFDYKPLCSLDQYLEGGCRRFFFDEVPYTLFAYGRIFLFEERSFFFFEAFVAKDNYFEIAPKSAQKLNVPVVNNKFFELILDLFVFKFFILVLFIFSNF